MSRWRQGAVPAGALNWLRETGSLTRRLKARFPHEFAVDVVGQGWAKPFASDSLCLGLRHGQRAFVREVRLTSADGVLICARTTIPPRTLHGLKRLARVGSRSLGEVIFSYPDLHRTGLDAAAIDRASLTPMVQAAMGQSNRIWGRRNTYTIAGRPFLVSEFFLPLVTECS